ncbi:MAG: hypothetical protein WCL02_08160 [bacterium]
MDTEILSPEDALHAIENNTILEYIAALTRDMYGRQVGQVVSSEEMKKIKYIMETDPKQTQFYPKQDFEDSIMKATVRGLFHILNTFI